MIGVALLSERYNARGGILFSSRASWILDGTLMFLLPPSLSYLTFYRGANLVFFSFPIFGNYSGNALRNGQVLASDSGSFIKFATMWPSYYRMELKLSDLKTVNISSENL